MTIADTIADLERKYGESTQGEWTRYCSHYVARGSDPNPMGFSAFHPERGSNDAAFIVAVHNGLPALLEYVRALEEVERRAVMGHTAGSSCELCEAMVRTEAIRANACAEQAGRPTRGGVICLCAWPNKEER